MAEMMTFYQTESQDWIFVEEGKYLIIVILSWPGATEDFSRKLKILSGFCILLVDISIISLRKYPQDENNKGREVTLLMSQSVQYLIVDSCK